MFIKLKQLYKKNKDLQIQLIIFLKRKKNFK